MPFGVLDAVEERAADRVDRVGPLAAGVTTGLACVVMGAFALRMAGTESPSPRPQANDLPASVGFSIASAAGTVALASALAKEAPPGLGARLAVGPGGAGLVVTGRF